MIDFFKNWCKLRWARLGSWKRLYWRDTQAASKCVKHRRGQYSTTDGQEWIHHSVFQTRWVPNRRSRAIGWVVQGIWKACQIWKIYFGNLKEGFLQYILWQTICFEDKKNKYPWFQIIFQNDAKGRVMRIPSQTVQSEDDVDKSNHEKDPIFKDDTSKGILSLFCLLSRWFGRNSSHKKPAVKYLIIQYFLRGNDRPWRRIMWSADRHNWTNYLYLREKS